MNLIDQQCVSLNNGVKALSRPEIQMYLGQLKGWVLKDQILDRTFHFQNFKESMKFVNQVADIAETEGHHPDFYIFYDTVRLELTTHGVKGLSMNDFIVAAKIDKVPNPANV